MRRKITKEKLKDELNPNLYNQNKVKLKPPIPSIIPNADKLPHKLKDKVTSLVQMQLKYHQSNQNYLIHEHITQGVDNENEKNISIYINTKYDVVEKIAKQMFFKVVKENEDWNISWIDGAINSAKAFNLKRNQRVNHFPGMNEISRKDKLQKNLKIMQRYFPLDYNIFPRTWSLPAEKNDILNYLRDQGHEETFIIKPACSSQGRGIILINDIKSLSVVGNTICQSYITNPFLIDGFKFDLRIYVLITSCDPFRIYIYEEGLARFATHKYEKPNRENLHNVYMHLTNYSVQRNSDKFDLNEISGTKRRSSTIYEWYKKNGYDADSIWKSIDDVIIKTMLCANNSIQHHYCATFPDQYRTSACFELLGFDVILDDNLKPYVLEVNHSPSLETETNLDLMIKSQLLIDIFNLVNSVPSNIKNISDVERIRSAERLYWSKNKYMSSRKASVEFRKILKEIQIDLEKNEMDNRNGFRILYPVLNQTEKYQKFFEFNCENHRNSYNRCSSLDESEHRRFLDIQRDCFPGVINMNKTCKPKIMHENSIKPFKTEYQHLQPISRDSHIVRQFNCNVSTGLKTKDVINPNRNSNILLNTSTKSLKKILSYKKYAEISKIINEKKLNSESKGLIRKSSDSCSRSNSGKISRHSDIEMNTQKSHKERKNKNDLLVHQVHESSLNQQTIASLEWESSLSSNKIQYVSQLNFEIQNKASLTSNPYLKMFQNSPESTIISQNSPISNKNENIMKSLNELSNSNLKLVPIFKTSSENSINSLNTNKISQKNFKKECSNFQNTNYFEANTQSIFMYTDSCLDSSFTEKESEHLYSTNLNSSETNNYRKIDNNFIELEAFCNTEIVNNLMDDSDISEKFSIDNSNESLSLSDIHYSKTVFAAEIEDHPDLSLNKMTYDTLKYFHNSLLGINSINSEIMENIFNIAQFDNTKKSIYCSETKSNPQFNQDNPIRKHGRTRNSSGKIFARNQTAYKRKYFSTPVTYGFDLKEIQLENDETMEYVQPINIGEKIESNKNFNSNQIIEIDHDLSIIDEINFNEKMKNENKYKSVSFNNSVIPSIITNNNQTENSQFSPSDVNKEKTEHSQEYIEESNYEISKKRKPINKNIKLSHQRVATYNIEPKFSIDRFIKMLNPTFREKVNSIKIDSNCHDRNLIVDDYSMSKTNRNFNNNICEINISPSTVTENSDQNNDNYNFTISINSNLENSVVNESKNYKLVDTYDEENNSEFLNQESIYHNAMINNKNTNHLFENKIRSKPPMMITCFKHSMKKIDQYVDMCMGNNSRYIHKCNDIQLNQLTPASDTVKWDTIRNKTHSKNVMFRLPEITIRGINNVIHLFPHRKHKNKSFNLESFHKNQFLSRSPEQQFESTLKYLSVYESVGKSKNFNRLNLFQNSETNRTNKSMLCNYLKNVGQKNKFSRPSKLSSTKRLCKILIDKTNTKNKIKSKDDSFHEYHSKSKFQYDYCI